MKKFEQKFTADDYDKVVGAFCEDYNYQEQIEVDGEMEANPESKEDFADRIIFEYIERQTFVNNSKKDDEEAKRVRTKTKKVKRN